MNEHFLFPGLDCSRPIMREDVLSGLATPEGFLIENFFQIINREGKDAPFILNQEQRQLDYRIAQRIRKGLPVKFFIPKARRRGISAYITARFTAKANTSKNIDAAVVAHRDKEVKKLFNKVHYYVRNFRGAPMRVGTDSTIEVSFPETNSSIGVFTAGSKEVARGLDCNHLHLSEAAYYENPKSLVASLVQTIPGTGEVFIESTGNGQGTWYHRRCLRAWENRSSYGIIFFPWHLAEDTLKPLSEEEREALMLSVPDPEYGEQELLASFPGLAPERLAWRRDKIDELDYDLWLFKQEHPMTFQECFIPSTRSYFHKIFYTSNSPRWIQESREFAILEGHPNKALTYGLGVDVSAGVENDYSTVQILCRETNEQVCEFRSNRIAPNDFAEFLEDLGRRFFWPLAVIEANNHGHITLDNLVRRGIYPGAQIYWDEAYATNITQAGFTTNRKSKPFVVGRLRTALSESVVAGSTAPAGSMDSPSTTAASSPRLLQGSI